MVCMLKGCDLNCTIRYIWLISTSWFSAVPVERTWLCWFCSSVCSLCHHLGLRRHQTEKNTIPPSPDRLAEQLSPGTRWGFHRPSLRSITPSSSIPTSPAWTSVGAWRSEWTSSRTLTPSFFTARSWTSPRLVSEVWLKVKAKLSGCWSILPTSRLLSSANKWCWGEETCTSSSWSLQPNCLRASTGFIRARTVPVMERNGEESVTI